MPGGTARLRGGGRGYRLCRRDQCAVRLVEATVNDVMGLCAAVKVNEQDAGHLAAAARRTGADRRKHLSEFAGGADGVSDAAHDEYPTTSKLWRREPPFPRSSYRKDGT